MPSETARATATNKAAPAVLATPPTARGSLPTLRFAPNDEEGTSDMTEPDPPQPSDPGLFGATVAFHEAVHAGDMHTAWQLMTPDYRLVVVQSLLDFSSFPVGMRDSAAQQLIAAEPPLPERDVCWSAARRGLMGALGCAPDAVSAGQTVHIEAPALEVVNAYLLEDLVPDETGRLVFAPGTYARALQFIMESQPDGGWLVAGLGRLMRPGWPPVVVWTPPSYLGLPPDGT